MTPLVTGRSDGSYRALLELVHLANCAIRLELLLALGKGPRDVSALVRESDLEVSVVSGHLVKLARAGLVVKQPAGRRRIYALSPSVEVEQCDNGVRLELCGLGGVRVAMFIPMHAADRLGPPSPPTLSVTTVLRQRGANPALRDSGSSPRHPSNGLG